MILTIITEIEFVSSASEGLSRLTGWFEIMSSTDMVRVEESDLVIDIKLNRPDKLNAINERMIEELHDIWTELTKNPEKAVLISGAGDVTCAGADKSIIEDTDFTASESNYEHLNQEVFQMIQEYPQPTVMACQGAAIGAGFILAMECDFTILGEDTTFHYPETQMGLFSDRLPKLLMHTHGAQVAREVTLKSEPIDPRDALNLGLVTEVVPKSRVEDTARGLASKLAGYDDKVVELLKQELYFDYDPDGHVGYP